MIDATISTIGRVGYSGTTLNHVAGAAGLSPGIVNFYFKSKDQLLAATLAQLAEEHELLWLAKIAAAGGSPEGGLDAMIEADFDPSICTIDKVVVWFAFWAEAQSRPLYRSVVSELEERYFQQTHAFCAELIEQGGYPGIDPADVARGLNAISDGLWADLLCCRRPSIWKPPSGSAAPSSPPCSRVTSRGPADRRTTRCRQNVHCKPRRPPPS